jgi:hypothetical protein
MCARSWPDVCRQQHSSIPHGIKRSTYMAPQGPQRLQLVKELAAIRVTRTPTLLLPTFPPLVPYMLVGITHWKFAMSCL